MRRLIEFRPGVFARAGDDVIASDGRKYRFVASYMRWAPYFPGGRWVTEVPPELRTFPTATTEQQRPLYRGWDWET